MLYRTEPVLPTTSRRHLIVVIPTLLLVIFPLLLCPLAIPLLGFELLLPQLTRLVLVEVGEDQIEDLAVPFDGVA